MPSIPIQIKLPSQSHPKTLQLPEQNSPQEVQVALRTFVETQTGQVPSDEALTQSTALVVAQLESLRLGVLKSLPILEFPNLGTSTARGLKAPATPSASDKTLGNKPSGATAPSISQESLSQLETQVDLLKPASNRLDEVLADGYLPYDDGELRELKQELITQVAQARGKPLQDGMAQAATTFLDEVFQNWTAISSHDMHQGKLRNIPNLDVLLSGATTAIGRTHQPSKTKIARTFAQMNNENMVVMQGLESYKTRFLDVLPEDNRAITGHPVSVGHLRQLSPFASKLGVLNEPEMARLQTEILPALIQDLQPFYRRFGSNKKPLSLLDKQVKKLPRVENASGQTKFLPWLQEQIAQWQAGDCGHHFCEKVVAMLEATVDIDESSNIGTS